MTWLCEDADNALHDFSTTLWALVLLSLWPLFPDMTTTYWGSIFVGTATVALPLSRCLWLFFVRSPTDDMRSSGASKTPMLLCACKSNAHARKTDKDLCLPTASYRS
jgi:hypothetical protein